LCVKEDVHNVMLYHNSNLKYIEILCKQTPQNIDKSTIFNVTNNLNSLMASSFTNLGCIEQTSLHPLEVAQNTIHPCPSQNWYKTSKVIKINLINFDN
jgi:hypothetical protein